MSILLEYERDGNLGVREGEEIVKLWCDMNRVCVHSLKMTFIC